MGKPSGKWYLDLFPGRYLKGLKDCYADLAADVKNQYGLTLKRVVAMGVSAMMHGYMAFDADENCSFRSVPGEIR